MRGLRSSIGILSFHKGFLVISTIEDLSFSEDQKNLMLQCFNAIIVNES